MKAQHKQEKNQKFIKLPARCTSTCALCVYLLPRRVSHYVNNPTSVMMTQFVAAYTISQSASVVSAHNHQHHHHRHHYQTSIKAKTHNGVQGSEWVLQSISFSFNLILYHMLSAFGFPEISKDYEAASGFPFSRGAPTIGMDGWFVTCTVPTALIKTGNILWIGAYEGRFPD